MLRSFFGLTHDMPVAAAAEAVMSRLNEIGMQGHGPELLRALSFAPDKAADAKQVAPESTVAAVKLFFRRLVEQDALVLFIDDWQWVDAATSQVLAATQALEGSALLVLVATRGVAPGDATMNEARIVELSPFSEQEAAQSISELLPKADPFVAAEINRYSGGNPLFIEELCHSAAHEDMDRRLVRLHGGAAWLNVLIESRVARLPEAQAELVRTAAVVGTVIPSWLLQDLTGCAEDHPLVRGLANEDFIFPGEVPGSLRFKHGITRDVVYDSVGLRAHKAMHLRIADALRRRHTGEQDEAHEALAYHYGASDHLADAAHYAELAGDKAVAVSALDRAKAQYRAALKALDGLEITPPLRAQWLGIANKLGLVCVFDADRQDTQTFKRAVALAQAHGDKVAIARAEYWLGYIHYGIGESRAAIRHCELALEALQGASDDPLAVQVRATLGQARTAACDYAGALPLLDEAIAIKRRYRSGSRPAVGLAFSLVCRSWVVGDQGDFTAAHDCLDEASASVGELIHEIRASIQGWRAALLLWQGRWAEAERAAAESTQVAEQTRSLFQFCMGRAMQGYAQWRQTQAPEALRSLQQATEWLAPRETGLFRSLNHGWLAEGLFQLGERAQARHHAAKALVRGRGADLIGVAMAYRALACDAAARHNRPRAQHGLDLAMKVALRRGSAHEIAVTQLCEAGIARLFDDALQARRQLDLAIPAFERMGMAWHLAEATRLAREL
jgi:tetratricopeptide (TPR) repeat protein